MKYASIITLTALLGASCQAMAQPSIGFAFQADHVSYLRTAQTSDNNMITGIFGIAPIEWLALEGRLSLSASELVLDYDTEPREGQTKLMARAGAYVRAMLPVADKLGFYALAGRDFSMFRTGNCDDYDFRHETEFGTYYEDCGSVHSNRNGFVYGGGVRLGSRKGGWLNLEATQMAKKDDGYGFTTISLGVGVGF